MKLSHHNTSLIKMIVVVISIVTLPTHATENWPFGIVSSKIYMDFSEINDSNTDRKIYSVYSFNEHLTIEASYYSFGEASKGKHKLSPGRYQLTSVNLNKWMQCKSMQCWHGIFLLTETGGNTNCCALV